jgi:hypothetical protein
VLFLTVIPRRTPEPMPFSVIVIASPLFDVLKSVNERTRAQEGNDPADNPLRIFFAITPANIET